MPRGTFNEPDFEAVYGLDSPITPRLAARLWEAGGTSLPDFDDSGGNDITVVLDWLPPVARRYSEEHDSFLSDFADRIRIVRQRIAEGLDDKLIATCTADELVVHRLIAFAILGFKHDGEPYYLDELPVREGDEDFEDVADLLEDEDVLMLDDPDLEGVESIEWTEGCFDPPVNLHPRDWFKPFRAGLEHL